MMRRLLSVLVPLIGLTTLEAAHGEKPHPAFVVVERLETTADESVQERYAKLAQDIVPKYGGRYLAKSRKNLLLEGDGTAPCCIAILEFPSVDAARRWYDSAENRDASLIRRSGARFRIVAIEGE
jgi:uncharacterized protein (DUF1330 family)